MSTLFLNKYSFNESGQNYHALMILKCILALHIISCFVYSHTVHLLSDLQLEAQDIECYNLLQAVQPSQK